MSHHFDTAIAREDPRLNILDFYLFRGQPGTTVMAMTVNPNAGTKAPDTFHEEGLYAFRFDVNDDAHEEVTFGIRFGEVGHAEGRGPEAGLFGATVAKADELEDALRAALGHDGPALVDVHTARQELALPPKLTYGQIKGFSLYATRTILSGGGEELVELAKTNLRELAAE